MATISPASANTVTTLNGLFKEVYSDKIKDLVPSHTKLVSMIPFSKGEKQLGNQFNEPVILGLEGGFTYGGTDGDAFNLNDIVSFPMKNATVKSAEMVLRSAISVGAASRSVSSKNAFERGTKLLVGNMLKSMYHRLEVQLMYGDADRGIGQVEAVQNGAGTLDEIQVEAREWAPGIWVGLNSKIDIYDVTGATKRNTSTDLYVRSVSLEDKTIRITDAAGSPIDLSGLASAVVATDIIFFEGAKGKEFKGIHDIAETRGTLFGIDNTSEVLFQGNLVDVGASEGAPAVLSFAKIEEAVARSVEKGLGEEEICVLVNPNSWNNLLTEQTAKRRYDSSYSSAEMEDGAKSLKFHGQNGPIVIKASTFVKEGYAYSFCEKELVRVGSTDITFDPPGYEGEFFKLLENANGYEMRCYSDQALFTARPSCITILRYITS